MLDLQTQRFHKLAFRFTPQPEYGTDQLSILRELVLAREGHHDCDGAAADVGGVATLRESLASSHSLSTHVH